MSHHKKHPNLDVTSPLDQSRVIEQPPPDESLPDAYRVPPTEGGNEKYLEHALPEDEQARLGKAGKSPKDAKRDSRPPPPAPTDTSKLPRAPHFKVVAPPEKTISWGNGMATFRAGDVVTAEIHGPGAEARLRENGFELVEVEPSAK